VLIRVRLAMFHVKHRRRTHRGRTHHYGAAARRRKERAPFRPPLRSAHRPSFSLFYSLHNVAICYSEITAPTLSATANRGAKNAGDRRGAKIHRPVTAAPGFRQDPRIRSCARIRRRRHSQSHV